MVSRIRSKVSRVVSITVRRGHNNHQIRRAIKANRFRTKAFQRTRRDQRLTVRVVITTTKHNTFRVRTIHVTRRRTCTTIQITSRTRRHQTIRQGTVRTMSLPRHTVNGTFTKHTLIRQISIIMFTTISHTSNMRIICKLHNIPLHLARRQPTRQVITIHDHLTISPLQRLRSRRQRVFTPRHAPFTSRRTRRLTMRATMLLIFLTLVPRRANRQVQRSAFRRNIRKTAQAPLQYENRQQQPQTNTTLFTRLATHYIQVNLARHFRDHIPYIRLQLPFTNFRLRLLLHLTYGHALMTHRVITTNVTKVRHILTRPTHGQDTTSVTIGGTGQRVKIRFNT